MECKYNGRPWVAAISPMGPSMRDTTVIRLNLRTISARNGYEFSFSACDTTNNNSAAFQDFRIQFSEPDKTKSCNRLKYSVNFLIPKTTKMEVYLDSLPACRRCRPRRAVER